MKFNLNTRDLVNVGIFAVIYTVVFFMGGMMGIFGPWVMFIGWAVGVLLGGIVIMLYLARTPKMGALTLIGLFAGLVMVLTGHPLVTLIGALLTGFIGDLIATRGGNAKRLEPKRAILGYAVFTLWYVGPLLPIFWQGARYFDAIKEKNEVSPHNLEIMQQLFSPPVIIGWTVVLFILGLIGGWLGTRAWKKHFSRAGLTR